MDSAADSYKEDVTELDKSGVYDEAVAYLTDRLQGLQIGPLAYDAQARLSSLHLGALQVRPWHMFGLLRVGMTIHLLLLLLCRVVIQSLSHQSLSSVMAQQPAC